MLKNVIILSLPLAFWIMDRGVRKRGWTWMLKIVILKLILTQKMFLSTQFNTHAKLQIILRLRRHFSTEKWVLCLYHLAPLLTNALPFILDMTPPFGASLLMKL